MVHKPENMEKWSFNSLLFRGLTKVLDISGAEISRRCGMTQQVLNRYMNNEIDVSVQVLIKMCNSLRMPIYYFITENNNHVSPNRESATISEDYWEPIQWDKQAAELMFGDGEGRIYWKDVAKAMEVSSQKPHERFLLKKRFPVDAFLMTCSRLGLSPFKFLIDNNKEQHHNQGRQKDITKDIRHLSQKIDRLTDTVDELASKYKALLERHNQLENIVNGYLGYGHPLTASEPETEG